MLTIAFTLLENDPGQRYAGSDFARLPSCWRSRLWNAGLRSFQIIHLVQTPRRASSCPVCQPLGSDTCHYITQKPIRLPTVSFVAIETDQSRRLLGAAAANKAFDSIEAQLPKFQASDDSPPGPEDEDIKTGKDNIITKAGAQVYLVGWQLKPNNVTYGLLA